MARYSIPKGTKDVLPQESYKWHAVEAKMRETARLFGMQEIRTPTFEQTELFARGVGDTTDIVNKEMYTFEDKGGRSMTLRPEGTAGVARAYIENNLQELPQPFKVYYIGPAFRYERPQAGRLREHHQFGVEIYGSYSPYADADAILVAKALLERVGIRELTLNLNSIGCKNCRKEYNAALVAYFKEHIDGMCPVCKERLDKNPLRILDCKEEKCIAINLHAPKTIDYLCDDCQTHHQTLKTILEKENVRYVVNPRIVRGLDYYTGTVFEFISDAIGAQGTVCGGGRYNNLVEEVGGKPCPAVGFGMGIERLIMAAEGVGVSFAKEKRNQIYIAPLGDAERLSAYALAMQLRRGGIAAETDLMGKSLKAQMKFANKADFAYVAVLGAEEIARGTVYVKHMETGAEEEVALESLAAYFKNK